MTHVTPESRSFMVRFDRDDRPAAELWSDRSGGWGAVASSALIHKVRWHTGLTQAEFSETYRIGLDHLRALERGAVLPDAALIAYLKVIDYAPAVVRTALAQD